MAAGRIVPLVIAIAVVMVTGLGARSASVAGQEPTATPSAAEGPPGMPPARDAPPGMPPVEAPPVARVSARAGEAPAADECTVAPLPRASLELLVGTPEAAPAAAAEELIAPEDAEAADAETAEAITATVRELAACNNAGEILRFLALFSRDNLARSAIRLTAADQETYDLLSTPTPPPPAQHWRVVSVAEVQVLPDGRVRAVVTIDNLAQAGTEAPAAYAFVAKEGRWLVDEVVPLPLPVPGGAPPPRRGGEGGGEPAPTPAGRS